MSDKDRLVDLYKLHGELAERAAGLREEFTKLYTGMVSAIVAAGVMLHRLTPSTELAWVLPVLGVAVSVSWLLSFLSVTARLSAKNKALVELEQEMPFHFLEREQALFKPRILRRKVTGSVMPAMFLVVCSVWLCNAAW